MVGAAMLELILVASREMSMVDNWRRLVFARSRKNFCFFRSHFIRAL